MDITHKKNIEFLTKYLNDSTCNWLDYASPIDISYFSSGGGTHLYLIQNDTNKYVARINFYPLKNGWKVKRAEFETLKQIESLHIAPKAFDLNENNALQQDFTIVEFIEGEPITTFRAKDIKALARDLKKLHTFPLTSQPPELPYTCTLFTTFAQGEDKQIEKYDFPDIATVTPLFNDIRKDVGTWFEGLTIFQNCTNLCLCHGDLKSENILRTKSGIMLIDWECAGIDIPETDIAYLFSGCTFTEDQQNLFLMDYFEDIPDMIVLERISSIKLMLDFFRILEDYCIHQRKPWDATAMKKELERYQKQFKSHIL